MASRLRHFPQSFEYSTLGGWIATRSGGHFASLYTHIDDFVENLRVVTPRGILETRRLPGSGAGPSPDRMFIGSEGTLGVISRAWMRLQPRPKFRAGASVRFQTFFAAARAVRAIAQAGLYPSNCRILDPQEAFNTGAADGSVAIMVLGFESGDHAPDAWMARALECCADHGGTPEPARAGDAHLEGAAGIWRNAFIRMPYAREFLTPAGLINDTFETAITWDRFEAFHDHVKAATERAILAATGVQGEVTCRFTHLYPDGPAPYFSFHAIGRHGALLEQWQAIKNAASDALIEAGGTITHHHAVGRDHRPWYDRQRPELFAAALSRGQAGTRSAGHAEPGRADRSVSGACCPCFETLASLAPQHEVVVFQQVRPHPENLRMFRSRPENFAFDGLTNSDRKVFNCAGPLMGLCGRLLAWALLFMPLAPWRARRRSASCYERPRTTADGCGP